MIDPNNALFSAITKTGLFKYIENFTSKTKTFQIKKKKSEIFHISAQNRECGFSLEPPRRGGSNVYPQYIFFGAEIRKTMYTPVNPVVLFKSGGGLRGSKLYRQVFVMQKPI